MSVFSQQCGRESMAYIAEQDLAVKLWGRAAPLVRAGRRPRLRRREGEGGRPAPEREHPRLPRAARGGAEVLRRLLPGHLRGGVEAHDRGRRARGGGARHVGVVRVLPRRQRPLREARDAVRVQEPVRQRGDEAPGVRDVGGRKGAVGLLLVRRALGLGDCLAHTPTPSG